MPGKLKILLSCFPPGDDYHDPAERLLRADGGRRIAGFAPVPSPTRPTADPVARECGPENGAPTVREWEILSLTFNLQPVTGNSALRRPPRDSAAGQGDSV